jgi:hypothetical protein
MASCRCPSGDICSVNTCNEATTTASDASSQSVSSKSKSTPKEATTSTTTKVNENDITLCGSQPATPLLCPTPPFVVETKSNRNKSSNVSSSVTVPAVTAAVGSSSDDGTYTPVGDIDDMKHLSLAVIIHHPFPHSLLIRR